MNPPRILVFTALYLLLIGNIVDPAILMAADNEILDLELKELMQIQITSVGRKAQNISDVPAAVYVINQNDIKNSGATSIPEVLRIVPGLQVARISSSKWAISSRGFNGTFANKLLVQIDGRSVYTPTYSGVYWGVQNVVLDDVERIEVIRGPGATLWGSNAVNGIINIITKPASDTQGVLLSAATGSHDNALATIRYGTQINEDTYGRFYLNRHDQASYTFAADKSDASDDWQMTSGGFRFDGDVGLDNSWTVQGDLYRGKNNQRIDTYWSAAPPYFSQVKDRLESSGYNLVARWQHNYTEKSSWTLQVYYDVSNRDEIILEQTQQVADIDFQHRFQPAKRHDLVWGVDYRLNKDDFDNTYQVSLTPDSQTTDLFSAFLQDEITLLDNRIWLTLGAKFEHNDYTGMEIQPNLRLLWKPKEKHSFWTSVARAVRTPSRIEDSGAVTTYVVAPPTVFAKVAISGDRNLKSEKLIAYEAGYRYHQNQDFSINFDFFYNDYSDLLAYRQTSQLGTIYFSNAMEAHTYGFEVTTEWAPFPWLENDLSYSYIEVRASNKSPSDLSLEAVTEGSSPQHQISLRSKLRISENFHINLWGRYTDSLPTASVVAAKERIVIDDYFSLDSNIIWQIKDGLELSLVGQNLLDNRHLEFVQESFTSPIEIERSVYAKLLWEF